ncbi:MAG: RICIN domain-containing protein [Treponema sp.]|nr:RICIN domain-containing protein [Treponema sp.]
MKLSVKLLALCAGFASLVSVTACSDSFRVEGASDTVISRSALSGENGTVEVSGMSNGSLTVSYTSNPLYYARLFVSEGNGAGIVLANRDMNYSNGKYTYTLSHGTFVNGAKIYVCVLINDGTEKCVPKGVLASSTSWASVIYGNDSSSGGISSSDITSGGVYTIVNKGSGKSLDNDGWSKDQGTNIIQWDLGSNQSNQQWKIESTGDGYYSVSNIYSGFVLDVNDWSVNNGGNVQQYGYNRQANQQWRIEKLDDGTYRFLNRNSNLALDVSGGSLDNGANVQQWEWNGTNAQRWIVSSAGSASGGTGSDGSGSGSSNSGYIMEGASDGKSVGGNGFSYVAYDNNFDTLVWSDEFEGNSLKSENWVYDTGAGGWGNSELETYTAGNNVKVANGVLDIEARADLTSARLKSAGKKQFQYGRIEARLKCSQGTGAWPAFWMLGNGSWPYCGEIDIMEHANYDGFVYETCHWNGNGSDPSSGYNHAWYGLTTNNNWYNNISNLDVSQWHTYSIEWTSTLIKFFVDNTQVMEIAIGSSAGPGLDAFNKPFYLLLNFAMGGQFTRIYNASAFNALPWHMYVDYVRVYQ